MSKDNGNLLGRPPKFNTVEELREKLENYFKSITISTPRTHEEKDGEEEYSDSQGVTQTKTKRKTVPTLNDLGEPIIHAEYIEIPSILGMCRYLGISRETLCDYGKKENFSDTIKESKDIIEQYNANELYRDKQVTGIIFNLKNNFGWVDKTEVESTLTGDLNVNTKAVDTLKGMLGKNKKK